MKKILTIIVGFFLITFTVFAEGEEYFGKVFLRGEFLNGDLLRISVVASEMTQPVLGVAFTLNFESDKLDFLKYEPGDFLERGGDPFYLVKDEEIKVIFGETLRRNDSFPVGEGKVSDFYFQIIEEEEFSFSFYNGVISTLDVVRQDIDKILWEDALITRGDGEEVIDFGGGPFSLVKNSSFEISRIFPWLIVVLGASGSFFLYFFWKKQEEKRP